MKPWPLILPCLLAVAMTAAARSVGSADKPNFILVLTDDQGWTDTSVRMMAERSDSRSDFYRTPNLERLASEGMVFSNGYAPAPTCTPSRGSIQFGKTPAQLRQTVVHDVLAKSRGIDCADEVSIAQMIKAVDSNYVTAHFGKWGFPPRPPEHAGYDVTDGKTNNGDGDYSSVKDRTPLPPDDPKRIFSLTQRANAFMEEQVRDDRPFFMQVSHYAAHAQRGTEALIFHFPWYDKLPMSAIRWGDYKLVKDLNTGKTRLFNVVQELGEQRDLSRDMPAEAESLHAMLTDYLRAVDAESIADMRTARREELQAYTARTQREIDDTLHHLETTSDHS